MYCEGFCGEALALDRVKIGFARLASASYEIRCLLGRCPCRANRVCRLSEAFLVLSMTTCFGTYSYIMAVLPYVTVAGAQV